MATTIQMSRILDTQVWLIMRVVILMVDWEVSSLAYGWVVLWGCVEMES